MPAFFHTSIWFALMNVVALFGMAFGSTVGCAAANTSVSVAIATLVFMLMSSSKNGVANAASMLGFMTAFLAIVALLFSLWTFGVSLVIGAGFAVALSRSHAMELRVKRRHVTVLTLIHFATIAVAIPTCIVTRDSIIALAFVIGAPVLITLVGFLGRKTALMPSS